MVKQLLISTFCAGSLLFASAQVPARVSTAGVKSFKTEQKERTGKILKTGKVLSSKRLSKDVTLQIVEDPYGQPLKRLVSTGNNKISKANFKSKKSAALPENVVLKESFEDWDGSTEGWLPEGWSIESKGLPFESEYTETWFVEEPYPGYEPDPDGQFYEAVFYNQSNSKDEWLITPAVTLTDNPVLYCDIFVSRVFMFNVNDGYVDWDNMEFIKKECITNVQICIKAEGDADWTVLKDYYEECKDMTFQEISDLEPSELEREAIVLTGYEGKKVQIGFRYFGVDGNNTYVDDIQLSNPQLDACYTYPDGTLFYGIDKNFTMMNQSIPLLPVNQKLYFFVDEGDDDDSASDPSGVKINYQWTYEAPDRSAATSSGDYLAVEYKPDYTSASSCMNNFYSSPILTATAEGAAPSEFTRYDMFQAGGKAEMKDDEGYYAFGSTVFDANTEGIDLFVVDTDDATIPPFGYADGVDKYWTDYTFGGKEGEGDGVKLTALINYMIPTDSPMAYDEAWLIAKGQISENAEFTLEVIPLTEEGTLGDVYAKATVKGSDCIIVSSGGIQNYITVPFKFAQPVVMSQDICSAYVLRFSGFNDPDNVTYFAPYQSAVDNPDGFALGWVQKEITMNGETKSSLTPVAYYSGFQSFAIMVDGAYPWLDADADKADISESGVCEIALGSYYDGSELMATQEDGSALPEWLAVTFSGRYNEAKAVFTAKGDKAGTCNVKIAAPGVEKVITVSYDGSASVEFVSADAVNGESQVYNLTGQKVVGTPSAGLYLVRKADGKVYKQVVK